MSPQLGGERFGAVYRVVGTEAEARERALHVCLEQTVEFPEDLVRDVAIREQIFGRVESFVDAGGGGAWEVTISYAVETAACDFPQLLNVLFGNVSLLPGVRLERIALSDELYGAYRGPRLGREGLRLLARADERPLVATALKPMGLSPEELARQARDLARGGVDLVKDDHGLSDQSFCPFGERVARCAEAVREANARTGGACLYAPNVTARAELLLERAEEALEHGAGALVVSAGLAGLDGLRSLADGELGVPIVMHPALLGSYTVTGSAGMSHFVLYGQLARLAGADACIFPHLGGRFSFDAAACRQIAAGTATPMAHLKRAFPAPAGGMTLGRVEEVCEFYDGELILLVGGDLHRHPQGLVESAAELKGAVSEWAATRAPRR